MNLLAIALIVYWVIGLLFATIVWLKGGEIEERGHIKVIAFFACSFFWLPISIWIVLSEITAEG